MIFSYIFNLNRYLFHSILLLSDYIFFRLLILCLSFICTPTHYKSPHACISQDFFLRFFILIFCSSFLWVSFSIFHCKNLQARPCWTFLSRSLFLWFFKLKRSLSLFLNLYLFFILQTIEFVFFLSILFLSSHHQLQFNEYILQNDYISFIKIKTLFTLNWPVFIVSLFILTTIHGKKFRRQTWKIFLSWNSKKHFRRLAIDWVRADSRKERKIWSL